MKQFKIMVTLLLGLWILVSCVNHTPQLRVYLACDSYASSLETLLALRKAKRLSTDDIARVNAVRKVTNPICSQQIPPSDSASAGIAEAGAAGLYAVRGKYIAKK